MTENKQQTPDDRFREALEDAVMILKKLAPRCGDVNELTEMAELALSNGGQLRLLMAEVSPVRMRS